MSSNSNSSGIVILIIATIYCVFYVLPSASMIAHETLTLKLNSPTVTQQVAELDLKPALDLLRCLSEIGIWEAYYVSDKQMAPGWGYYDFAITDPLTPSLSSFTNRNKERK